MVTPDWDQEGYEPDGPLVTGPYTVEIERTAVSEANGSVLIAGVITRGEADENGKATEERELEVWIPFYFMDKVPEFRKAKAMNSAGMLIKLLGKDPEDWPGQSITLVLNCRPREGGGQWINVDDVRPA